MARIYLSSTHADLVEHRDRVYRTLRRMRHDVVATEDYVARDDRPLDACLEDVADCDLYVGLFAWRYGFVPDRDNPDRVSITELEYRHAGERGIPRLVFLLDPDIPWLPRFMDSQAREGDGGSRIGALRDALAAEQVVSFFGSPEDLAGKVGVAASHQLAAKLGADDGAVPPADLAPELRYREAIEARHATLELAGFKTALRAPIDLEALYVPLHAMLDLRAAGKAEFGGADEAEKRLREADAARDLPLFDAFHEAGQRNRRGLVILGEPGSGKTTHLKRLLLWCLRQGTEGLGLAPDLLPVFLPLRELDDTTKGLDAFIESQLDDPNLGVPAGFGARLLERDRLLLLFDGLDEVADPAERAEVSRWVESVARLRPTCVPVVTCRFAGYGGDARLGPEFLELHLRPLTREQSEDFIRKWYRIVETGLAIDPAAAEAAAREGAEALVTRLQAPDFRAARLVEMTRNPLLLANICLVHRDRGGALPRGRARLYDECVDVLLELWRENKRLDVAVSAEVGRRILQPAALWLHEEDGRTRATADELAPVLEPALAAVKWRSADAAVFLRTVRDESGLLTGWGQTQYGFMHLGFQEYLAACEIRRRALEGDDEVLGRLADRYGQSWWREVVLLLVALGNPSVFAPLMEAVVARRGFTEAPDLLDMVLEDAAEVAEAPFVALLRERPGRSPKQWARQHLAMHVLERLGAEESLAELEPLLRRHPSREMQGWLAARREERLRGAGEVVVTENGGVDLVVIPGGTFQMGSPADVGYPDEHPRHRVNVSPFHMGRYPVTNEEYARFRAANPDVEEPPWWSDRRFNGARQPVVGVTWEEACRFAGWVGGRLPTEAQWEYAARAGTTTSHWWADQPGNNRANFAGSGSEWSGDRTSPVDAFEANPFGLHDVHGNVWEWVLDCWHADYERAPGDGSAWDAGDGGDCSRRVLRGGSWYDDMGYARAAYRRGPVPDYPDGRLGFRVVLSSLIS